MASWKGDLMAELNRHKRYPSGSSASGTALVAFSINRSGAVTSARLARSSGDNALDQEAVSLPRRASPLPKPPAGIGGGGSIALTVPIRFGR
jgi:protein TonB